MLSELKIKNLKPDTKRYMLRDDRNLYVEVYPNGGKYWRLRVHQDGKSTWRSLGKYPDVSLKEARLKRDAIHRDKGKGKFAGSSATFRDVALDWYNRKIAGLKSESHTSRIMGRLNNYIFPAIGGKPINEITAPDILTFLRTIEASRRHETAHRVLQIVSQVMRYSVAIGVGEQDPSRDLRGALTPSITNHFPTIFDPSQIGALLRAIDSLMGSPIVKDALLFNALTFVRPGELRTAQWCDIDMDKCEWRIPAEAMKMKRLHIVPLSGQALEVLDRMRPLTGHGRYVFPASKSIEKGDRPMSSGTMAAALRRLGYEQGSFTPHGFRSMASTILNDNGFLGDAIERQLAHVEGNKIRGIYNHAEHIEIRREMMQWWGDWLDNVKG